MGIKIKGKSSGVLEIVTQPSSSFEDIQQAIKDKLSKSRGFFSHSAVHFSGKKLSSDQKEELRRMMGGDFGIARVLFEDDAPPKPKAHPIKKAQAQAEQAESVSLVSKDYFDAKSVFIPHTLRSGQRVECEGDIVVLGDVNDGAEVIAGGSIAVMGTLRGLTHAGAMGRSDVVVAANVLRPKQLRISGKIAVFPPGQTGDVPEIAEYKQGSIVIRPLKPQSRPL